MKAREWLERGADKQDSFDALSDYWRGFNNLFAGKGQDRDLISNFLRMWVDEHLAQSLIDDHAKEVQLLISQPVVDMRGNGDSIEGMNQLKDFIEGNRRGSDQ